MATVESTVPQLKTGDLLSRGEFLRRWEAMPQVRKAELIAGVVYMPSPLSRLHGELENTLSAWLAVYRGATPGCQALNNATWLMTDQDVPQPDLSLRILPNRGGQSHDEGPYAAGAPEIAVEVCLTSAAYDLHQKHDLYRRAGVREYVVVLLHEREVRWHRREGDRFQVVSPPTDGVYRSEVFPGLWLDGQALLANDVPRLMAVLQQGLASPGHREFAARLQARSS